MKTFYTDIEKKCLGEYSHFFNGKDCECGMYTSTFKEDMKDIVIHSNHPKTYEEMKNAKIIAKYHEDFETQNKESD